jgi:hypothetical protein
MTKKHETPIIISNIMLIINMFLWGSFSSKDSIITASIVLFFSIYLNILVFNVFNIRGFVIKMGSTFQNKDKISRSILFSIKSVKWIYILIVSIMFFLGILVKI